MIEDVTVGLDEEYDEYYYCEEPVEGIDWAVMFYGEGIDKHYLVSRIPFSMGPFTFYTDRFYSISDDDAKPAQEDNDKFVEKYYKEIASKEPECLNENFVGSKSVDDYDGIANFTTAFPLRMKMRVLS